MQPFGRQVALHQQRRNAADIAGKPQFHRLNKFALVGEHLMQLVFWRIDRTHVARKITAQNSRSLRGNSVRFMRSDQSLNIQNHQPD